eukprot:Rmarinus@m.17441
MPSRVHLTPYERHFLSPWRKFLEKRRFPAKSVLHIALIILTSVCFTLLQYDSTPYTVSSKRAFGSFFFPPEFDVDEDTGRVQLLTMDEFEVALAHVVDAYYAIHNNSVDRYTYVYVDEFGNICPDSDQQCVIKPLRVDIARYRNPDRAFDMDLGYSGAVSYDVPDYVSTFDEILDLLGPMRNFCDQLYLMSISLDLVNVNLGTIYRQSYKWTLTFLFSFAQRGGHIDLEIAASKVPYPSSGGTLVDVSSNLWFFWVCIAVISCSALLVVLCIRGLYASYRLYQRIMRQARVSADEWVQRRLVSLATKHRRQFYNFWLVVLTAAAVFNIAGAVLALADYDPNHQMPDSFAEARRFCSGMGCALCWLALLHYVSYAPRCYLLVRVVRRSMPTISRYLLGFIPMFFAFAVFGFTMFSTTSARFETFESSAWTLFSMMNGDSIRDVFDDVCTSYCFLASLFLYLFLMSFLFVGANVFFAIIESVYFALEWYERKKSQALQYPQVPADGSVGNPMESLGSLGGSALLPQIPLSPFGRVPRRGAPPDSEKVCFRPITTYRYVYLQICLPTDMSLRH